MSRVVHSGSYKSRLEDPKGYVRLRSIFDPDHLVSVRPDYRVSIVATVRRLLRTALPTLKTRRLVVFGRRKSALNLTGQ